MLLNTLHGFIAWLTRPVEVSSSVEAVGAGMASFEFDLTSHGDHWQNLLASPMDARRYVMEDWSVAQFIDWDGGEDVVPAR